MKAALWPWRRLSKSSLVLMPPWLKSQREFSHTLRVCLVFHVWRRAHSCLFSGGFGGTPCPGSTSWAAGYGTVGQGCVSPSARGGAEQHMASPSHLVFFNSALSSLPTSFTLDTDLTVSLLCFFSPLILRCKLIYRPNHSLSDLWKFNLFSFQSSILNLQGLLSICQKVSLLLGSSRHRAIVRPINEGNFVDLHFFSEYATVCQASALLCVCQKKSCWLALQLW